MNFTQVYDSIYSNPIPELSKFLIFKNGIQFQNLINVEENSELIVELLTGKSPLNLASETADVFVTMQHIITSYAIEQAVQDRIQGLRNKRIDKTKLAATLAQFSKEVVKNLNRDQNNLDAIIDNTALTTVGLIKSVQQNDNLDLVNREIVKKIIRTQKRNGYTKDYEALNKINDWDQIFLMMAFIMASGSHCVSRQVGALLVKNRRIISTGINGTPEGCVNCDDIFPPKRNPLFNRGQHHQFSEDNEIHAEKNAINFLARYGAGYGLDGATLYCTTQPCNKCMKELVATGISRIVYAESYDLSSYPATITDSVKKNNIEMIHKPILNTAKSFVFLQNALIKTAR